ncbi:rCG61132 [Rattus norvegicus]|uniref:RCG61132 n=1 Tax=Rattus norvegicus TaxID=10116 RepID=A6KE04_RAT|nr:rCG61132 [Rattus norvegicus]
MLCASGRCSQPLVSSVAAAVLVLELSSPRLSM